MRASGKRNIEANASSLASFRLTLSFAVCMTVLIAVGRSVARVDSVATTSTTPLARLSESISVHASGRGNPSINLSDGHDVLTSYSGPVELTQALQRNEAEPLALASSDFDEDGVPDLICGYGHSGSGIITLLRGNVDSIYPNAPEAQQRKAAGEFTDAPFLSPARVFGLPIKPEFLGAGDFDGDGHWDVVAASRTSDALYLLPGDGRGRFGEPRQIALPGTPTAFVTGEINRPDGLIDVVVAINGQDGPKALAFEGPEGALRAPPEIFPLPSEATSLALGQLEGDPMRDLAIASGNQLLIVEGRDRKLSLSKRSRDNVAGAVINVHDFPYTLRLLAIDYFTSNQSSELAILADDGSLSLLRARSTSTKATRGDASLQTVVIDRGTWSDLTKLVPARLSTKNVASLLIVDSNNNQIDVVTCNEESDAQQPNKKGFLQTARFASMKLDTDCGPTAVLPMRLNSDALNDLMVLRRGQNVPAVVETAAATTFTVININDSGPGSLRQAIIDANANLGADAIEFNIPGPGPFVIILTDPLPTVSDPVKIDGTSQPESTGASPIEITRQPGVGSFAIVITAGNSSVRGLNISANHPLRIFDDGIRLQTRGNNIIEGNIVETDNGNYQLVIENSNGNQIGEPVPGSGNSFVSFGSSAGIKIAGSNNSLQGNTVEALRDAAVSIDQGTGNLIGGDAAGAGNQIKASDLATGLRINTDLNRIQGNSITQSTPGVLVSGRNNTIGGTVSPARNVIFADRFADVSVSGSDNLVQGNVIGIGTFGGGTIGHFGVGVSGSRNAIGGSVDGARNIIAGHRGAFLAGAGVDIQGPDNEIGRNFIGTDITGKLALPNTIGIQVRGGARVIIEGNVISGNDLYGTFLSNTIGASVQNNLIGVAADGVQPLGNAVGLVTLVTRGPQTLGTTDSKVLVSTSPGTVIEDNVISSNGSGIILVNAIDALVRNNLIGVAADGVHPAGNTDSGVVVTQSPNTRIEENVISSNGEHGISIGGIFILGAGSGSETFFGGTGTTVSGNKIGTDIEGIRPLGNGKDGIFVENQSQTHIIESNIIAFNRNGVCLPNKPSDPTKILEDPAIQIHISENSIFSNAALGIDLGVAGVTANHFEDPANHEANHAQNFPVLSRATTDGGATTIDGSLNAVPDTTFKIEFFANSPDTVAGFHIAASADCIRQGQIFLGDVTVKTDGSGKAAISAIIPNSAPGGFINSTATSLSGLIPAGNTSEFSACVQLKFLNADISVEQTAVASVAPGSSLSYQVTVANNGPDLATNVVLVSRVPDNTTFDSFTAPAGWASRVPDRGGTGVLTSGVAGLFPGASATFTIVLNVNSKAEDGAIIARSATVSTAIPDLVPGNNTVTSNTVVRAATPTIPPDVAADVSISLSRTPPPEHVFEGDAITYSLTVTNIGPAAAKDIVVRQALPNNTTFASSTKPDGWSSDCPPADGTSDIKFCTASLALQASASFTITLTVNSDTEAQTRIEATATVTSKSDPNPDNNSANFTVTTEVRPNGPSIISIAVGDAITARGAGFSKDLAVFIDSVRFKDAARVKGSTRVIQKGRLTDGRSIAEAVPPGRVVKMKFRNSNGGETEVSFRK